MNSAGFLECLVTDSLGKNNFCTNAVYDPYCKKIVEITKMQLTNINPYDIINTELRKGNRKERNSQVEDIRPNRQRQLSRVAVTIRALQM